MEVLLGMVVVGGGTFYLIRFLNRILDEHAIAKETQRLMPRDTDDELRRHLNNPHWVQEGRSEGR